MKKNTNNNTKMNNEELLLTRPQTDKPDEIKKTSYPAQEVKHMEPNQ